MLTQRHLLAGFTLVEAMVTLAILGILAAVALPAFSNMRETTRLKGLAQAVMTDMLLAQTESHKRQITITLSLRGNNGAWCYGLNENTGCDCQTPGACMLNGQERTVTSSEHTGLTILSGVTGNQFNFRPQRRTVTAGHIKIQANGQEIRVVASGYGRIRECSPAGASNVPSLPACS